MCAEVSCHMTNHVTCGHSRLMESTCRLTSKSLCSLLMFFSCCVAQELCRHAESVQLNRVYTNSIHSMAATYGIEAAATTIVRVSSSFLWP